ncbi:MAG: metallophosphoesterase [Lachnospiraceae bacterium]|nr:metallophosphoesterase [Lachnospiraceae bacterium]
MIYFTGDIHGSPWGVKRFCEKQILNNEDILVLLGDVAANYFGDWRDVEMKNVLGSLAPTILCIHGNHEMRPWHIDGYHEAVWNGGKVWVQDQFPNLLFAQDGDLFFINGLRYIAIGGAYSVDKRYRLARGYGWWEDEQPSEEIKDYVEQQLRENDVDVILSHTCPFKYEPQEMFLPGLDQSSVDTSTERWLDQIEERTDYIAWFCGHWHTDKRIDKMHFLFHRVESEDHIGLNEDEKLDRVARRILDKHRQAFEELAK